MNAFVFPKAALACTSAVVYDDESSFAANRVVALATCNLSFTNVLTLATCILSAIAKFVFANADWKDVLGTNVAVK